MCVTATRKPTVVKCAMCAGHGCEPTLADGNVGLVPCWWCEGTGRVEVSEPLGDCPACGRERMAVSDGNGGHEAYCPSCTRFGVAGD